MIDLSSSYHCWQISRESTIAYLRARFAANVLTAIQLDSRGNLYKQTERGTLIRVGAKRK